MDSRSQDQLIELIYDAVPDPSRWDAFVEAFLLGVNAARGTLVLRFAERPDYGVFCWTNWTDEDVQLYRDRYATLDPWGLATGQRPEGEVACDYEFCDRDEMEASLAFREFYEPRGCGHGMGAVVLVTRSALSALCVCRGAEAGPFGEKEKAVLRPLVPHLKRAALLYSELRMARSQLATFTDHLDRYSHGFLIADRECRVLYMNQRARELVNGGDGVNLRDGVLTANSNEAIRKTTVEILNRDGEELRQLEIPRPSGKAPYRLLLMRISQSGVVPFGVSLPAIIIEIFDPEEDTLPDADLLREAFSLTQTEARVAVELSQGRSIEEISKATRTSSGTVRTHVKRLLSKTQTSRQGELISLILRSAVYRR